MSRFIAMIAVALSLAAGTVASAGGWLCHSHCCDTCCVVPKCRPSSDQFVNGELMTGIPAFPYPCGWCQPPFGDVSPSFPPGPGPSTLYPPGLIPTTVITHAPMPVPAAPPVTPANAPPEGAKPEPPK
jgi:hypothetical protein